MQKQTYLMSLHQCQIRFSSAQPLENSGILVQQMMSNNRIPGIECSPTPEVINGTFSPTAAVFAIP
jgi:hypothetical protein